MSDHVIYEVNLTVDTEAADAFGRWLAEHVDEMLAIDGFETATWYERRGDDEGHEHGAGADPGAPVLWTMHYRVRNRAALDAYFAGPAKTMRGDGLARFGGRFRATRRILAPRS